MKYTNINVEFTNPSEFPESEKKIKNIASFLETMLNSGMFKNFMTNEKYMDYEDNEEHVKGLSSEEIYEVFKSAKWDLKVKIVKDRNNVPDASTIDSKSMTYKDGVITYNKYVADSKPIYKLAATMLHEHAHHLGFHHAAYSKGSVGYKTSIGAHEFFRKFYEKLEGETYPQKGKWLTYEPVWIFKCWRRLKWN